MSYEKKIRELMQRLVSMSPEPPPYPEEALMARPETRRAPRPVLAFAAAAALVALLAVPLLLFTGGEEPVGVGSTTTSSTSTSLATSTTTPPPTTTTTDGSTDSTQAALPVWSRVVYFYQAPENSFVGNPAMIPVWIQVTDPSGELTADDEFTAALAAIDGEAPPGLVNAIPAAVQVTSLTATENDDGSTTWLADMNEAFLDGAGGLLADMTMLNQLIYTITDSTTISQVLFTVNGEPVEAFGSEGLGLTEPVDRETFRDDHLHVINLTSPIAQQEDGTYLVEGIANVFEATVSIAVLDGEGAEMHEEFVTATCGSGCWGEFSTGIDPGLIVPGESSIRVFQHSAEDGSIVDAITVPIPEGDVWDFTVGG